MLNVKKFNYRTNLIDTETLCTGGNSSNTESTYSENGTDSKDEASRVASTTTTAILLTFVLLLALIAIIIIGALVFHFTRTRENAWESNPQATAQLLHPDTQSNIHSLLIFLCARLHFLFMLWFDSLIKMNHDWLITFLRMFSFGCFKGQSQKWYKTFIPRNSIFDITQWSPNDDSQLELGKSP